MVNDARLPAELLMTILEYAYYDSNAQPDRRTLSVCTLLCTSWRALAQPLLFRHLRVPASRDSDDLPLDRLGVFRSCLFDSSERAQTLASHVRRAEIAIQHAQDLEAFVETAQHCPHLYELTLSITGSLHSFPASTITALSSRDVVERPAPIRALNVQRCSVQSPIVYQLLHIWPSIRHLRLGTELAAPPPRDMPLCANLYELSLARLPSIRAFAWLLSAPPGTLRIFECHVAPGGAHRTALARHVQHLYSLRLFRHMLGTASLLSQCIGLREVMITQLSDFLPLGTLPAGLEHFAFRHPPHSDGPLPPAVITAIEAHERLRLVSCDAAARRATNFGALEAVCTKQGIAVSHDVVPFRLHEDPVPLERLPRGRNIHNLRLMNPRVQG